MSIQTLRGELEVKKMNDSEDVSSYITCVQTIANQLKHNLEKTINGMVSRHHVKGIYGLIIMFQYHLSQSLP